MTDFNGTGVIHIDSSDLDKKSTLLFEGKPAKGTWLCMVQGDFCGFCKQAKPAFLKAMEMVGDQTTFCTLQTDGGKSESAANKMLEAKMGYRGVPSFILFKNGKPVKLHNGGRDKDALAKFATI